jgi:hypothetical protein
MRPVILTTIHRRYYELVENLKSTWELAKEFSQPPEIVVVWACPVVGHRWLFQQLLEDGWIHHVIERPQLPDESPTKNTTYPESHNLRVGLDFIKKNYNDCYVIVQIADIKPSPGVYAKLDRWMVREQQKAVVVLWDNLCFPGGAWHTNFLAVCLDERYWPPVSEPNHPDVLERQWTKKANDAALSGIRVVNNYRNKLFIHAHLSEFHPPLDLIGQKHSASVGMSITGRMPWWLRLIRWCISRWRK